MYFKGTKKQCIAYNDKVSKSEKYKGVTCQFDVVIEINNFFYITKHPNYSSDMEIVNELPENENDLI